MRKVASHTGIQGVSASEKLKERLSATSGMHHLLHGATSSLECFVLHKASRAARNFRHSALVSDGSHSIRRASSDLVGEENSRYASVSSLQVGVERQVATRNFAAIKIQAVYRGFTSRVWYTKATESVVKIQAAFKRWRTRKSYVERCSAALRIQSWYRARRLRRRYLLNRSRVTAIQAHARGFLVRRMVRSWNFCAGLIQRHWNLHKRRVRDMAATRIQAFCRHVTLRRRFLIARQSAVRIQATFKSWRGRRRYVVIHSAVLTIQRWWGARKRRTEFLLERCSSMVIQGYARGFLVRRNISRWNSAAACIQQHWRLHQGARHTAATRIQAAYRQVLVRKQFLAAREKAVRIQAAFRRWRSRKSYVEVYLSVLSIQRWYRVRKQIKVERRSLTAIQAHALVRTMVRKWNLAALSIQQHWKFHQTARLIAATRIQAFYRQVLARKQFTRVRDNAVRIQAAFRGWRARRGYAEMCSAVLAIQRWYQASRKTKVERRSITIIQAHARGFIARSRVRKWNLAAFCIQQRWRLYQGARRRAATRIQALHRKALVRKKFLLARGSVVTIQGALRAWLVQKKMIFEKTHATVIQAYVRRFLVTKKLKDWNSAACLIQQAWKIHRVRRVAVISATVIQAYARGFLARQKLRRDRLAACVHWKLQMNQQQDEACRLSPTEDWNSVEVEHLEECLDTCLGILSARRNYGLELPELGLLSPRPSDHKDNLSGYKESLKEKQLQQVARVFLLRHQIAVEQQRAKHAPPFPPAQLENQTNTANTNIANNNDKTIQQQPKQSGEPTSRGPTGDVILDVHELLEEVRRTDASSSRVVYMGNESFINILEEERTGLLERETSLRRHQPELLSLNVLLMVFVAVLVYTKSICQGVILWASKQSAPKK